jgi:hypothetical protein
MMRLEYVSSDLMTFNLLLTLEINTSKDFLTSHREHAKVGYHLMQNTGALLRLKVETIAAPQTYIYPAVLNLSIAGSFMRGGRGPQPMHA